MAKIVYNTYRHFMRLSFTVDINVDDGIVFNPIVRDTIDFLCLAAIRVQGAAKLRGIGSVLSFRRRHCRRRISRRCVIFLLSLSIALVVRLLQRGKMARFSQRVEWSLRLYLSRVH